MSLFQNNGSIDWNICMQKLTVFIRYLSSLSHPYFCQIPVNFWYVVQVLLIDHNLNLNREFHRLSLQRRTNKISTKIQLCITGVYYFKTTYQRTTQLRMSTKGQNCTSLNSPLTTCYYIAYYHPYKLPLENQDT